MPVTLIPHTAHRHVRGTPGVGRMERRNGASQPTVGGRRPEDSPLRSPVARDKQAHFGVRCDGGTSSLDAAAERGLLSLAPKHSSRQQLLLGAVVAAICCAFGASVVTRRPRTAPAAARRSLGAGRAEESLRLEGVRVAHDVRVTDTSAGDGGHVHVARTVSSSHREERHSTARASILPSAKATVRPAPSPSMQPEFGFEGVR
jgi:hypothetical protein